MELDGAVSWHSCNSTSCYTRVLSVYYLSQSLSVDSPLLGPADNRCKVHVATDVIVMMHMAHDPRQQVMKMKTAQMVNISMHHEAENQCRPVKFSAGLGISPVSQTPLPATPCLLTLRRDWTASPAALVVLE